MNRISSVIERLREKPKEVRVQVSFLAALCVTGVIGLLWGVTLPMRLSGLPKPTEALKTAEESEVNSFFADTKNNLSQIIGAAQNPREEPEESATPGSDAYRVGAPPAETSGYNDSPFPPSIPAVMPVDRREVRIGTTTSETAD